MSLPHLYKLLLVGGPFASLRKSCHVEDVAKADEGIQRPEKSLPARHLTTKQREDISSELQESAVVTGPISMTAVASDREAVGYENEIANVLEETGFEVRIDNLPKELPADEMPPGVEMAVKDKTVRPVHASRIVGAFRRAGLAIATRINKNRRKSDTLYISVGANDSLAVSPATIEGATTKREQLAEKV